MRVPMTLYGIRERVPGPRWQALFDATWPAYKGWYLSEGETARPDLATCRTALQQHMPELVPTWERLADLAGGDELAARMLSLWDPPRFLPGCSQAVLVGPPPALVRNYDYAPELFECVVLSSEFVRPVLGTGDCLWGLLDGTNDAGLVVSLAFGGRKGGAPGFGIPLVVRYLLEVAASVRAALAVLARLPVNMSYNLTMVDASGDVATAYVAPHEPPYVSGSPVSTNHRGTSPEDPAHAARFASVERMDVLGGLVSAAPGVDRLADAFLQPPLHHTDYSGAFGTLYTAVYRAGEGAVEYRWPDGSWRRTFADEDATYAVELIGA